MNKARTQIGFIFLLMAMTFLYGHEIIAQQWSATKEEKGMAYIHLNRLSEGCLIVILKGDQKKRNALQAILDDENTTAGQKKQAQKQLDRSIEDRKAFHTDISSAMSSLYTYSEYAMLYDHDLEKYLAGDRTVFVNNKLVAVDSCAPNPKLAKYFMKEEYKDGVLSWVVYPTDGPALKYPFPNVKLSNVGPALLASKLFRNSEYRPGDQIVERFNDMLFSRKENLEEDYKAGKLALPED